MATTTVHSFVCFVVFFSMVVVPSSSGQLHRDFCNNTPNSSGQLTPNYYRFSCPNVFNTVRRIVEQAIKCDPRMGASLLRLHFHDCWVNGCEGSVLLIDIGNFIGEQSAIPNKNSLRGFDVVAQIKAELNSVCRCGNVVSCADILAIAARDSIDILGGPWYQVLLGRLDSLTASLADANTNLPSPFSNFTKLIANFLSHGFGLKDLVVLSGAHTIGLARCVTFRSRIYKDNDINSNFANGLETTCPANASLGGNNTAPLDATTNVFDTVYYRELTRQMGLLHSDQELYSGGNQTSADLVTKYSKNRAAFWEDFVVSIIKMGNLPPASGNGQVRCNCSIVNNPSPPNNLGTTTSCPSPPASFFNPGTDPTHCPSHPTSSPNLGSP
ncbi:peroxidase RIP1-like [Rhododendron vialii]|uniref:peroxidase RIP1-like n=1 Tax=Rhododendron vialii TaxID=182163 RepID=UPI00265FE5B0|nr:peroxidase RIP1-like [Rhododendron vialii]